MSGWSYRRLSVPCPKCQAPVGAPCADWRSHDRDLFGTRVHQERRLAWLAAGRPEGSDR